MQPPMTHSARIRAEIDELIQLEGDACVPHVIANLEGWGDPGQVETPAELALYRARIRAIGDAMDALIKEANPSAHEQTLRSLVRRHEERISQFNTVGELPSGIERTLARYMIGRKYFRDIARHVAWLEARDAGLLRKRLLATEGEAPYSFYVIGLRYKVAAGWVRKDKRGRRHPMYIESIDQLGIRVTQDLPLEGADIHAFAATVPDLAPELRATEVGLCAGQVRPLSMTDEEFEELATLLRASRHIEAPVLVEEFIDATVPSPTAALPPANLDLFAADSLAA